MKKIPTIFKRNPNQRSLVTDEVNPECLWVIKGEGEPHRKYDGSCCKIQDGILWKRREIKKDGCFFDGFDLVETDKITGKSVGWVKVGDGAEDQWFREGFENSSNLSDGTYELVGPKSQGNPEKYDTHKLIKHSETETYVIQDRSFLGLMSFLKDNDIEGLVFHHPDGRMAKIKKRDFGLRR